MTYQVLIEPPGVKTKEVNHKNQSAILTFAESLKRQEIEFVNPNANFSLLSIKVSAQIFHTHIHTNNKAKSSMSYMYMYQYHIHIWYYENYI